MIASPAPVALAVTFAACCSGWTAAVSAMAGALNAGIDTVAAVGAGSGATTAVPMAATATPAAMKERADTPKTLDILQSLPEP